MVLRYSDELLRVRRGGISGSPPQSFIADLTVNENPMLRAGYSQDLFLLGGNVALDWDNMKILNGRIHCVNTVPSGFGDSLAFLNPAVIAVPTRQYVQGTIYIEPGSPITEGQEMELFVRTAMSAHSARGYETTISRSSQSLAFVRLQGAVGDFDQFGGVPAVNCTVANGDVFRVEADNSGANVVLTAFRNGVQILQFTDTDTAKNWQNGNVGLGGLMRQDAVTSFGLSAYSCGPL